MKIHDRPDKPTWFVFGGLDETGRYLFVSTTPGTDKNEVFVADLGDPMHPNVKRAHQARRHGGRRELLRRSAWRTASSTCRSTRTRRIARSSPRRSRHREPANWKTVIPEGTMPIEGASMVAGQIGVLTLQDVASVVRLYSLDGKTSKDVQLPGLGTASGLIGRFDRPEIFYSFTSPLQPATSFVYDAKAGTSQPFEAPKLTFNPALFATERVFYNSKDGTRVPMFVTHRKDMAKNGQNPAMLYAYGGFSISSTPGFRPSVIAWVEQGGVYALANIRGGGEYGEKWHQAGQFEKKQNVFDDFIAAGEYLVQREVHVEGEARDQRRIERRPAGRRRDDAASRPVRGGSAAGGRDGHAALRQVHRRRRVGDRVRCVERSRRRSSTCARIHRSRTSRPAPAIRRRW